MVKGLKFQDGGFWLYKGRFWILLPSLNGFVSFVSHRAQANGIIFHLTRFNSILLSMSTHHAFRIMPSCQLRSYKTRHFLHLRSSTRNLSFQKTRDPKTLAHWLNSYLPRSLAVAMFLVLMPLTWHDWLEGYRWPCRHVEVGAKLM